MYLWGVIMSKKNNCIAVQEILPVTINDIPIDGDSTLPTKTPEEVRNEVEQKITSAVQAAIDKIKEKTPEEYVLQNKLELLEQTKFITKELIITTLTDCPTPRSFEVLAKLIETASGLIDKIENPPVNKKQQQENNDKSQTEEQKEVIAASGDMLDMVMRYRHENPDIVAADKIDIEVEEQPVFVQTTKKKKK